MTVEFVTKNHQMLFVDTMTGNVASPGALNGSVDYRVFLELKNNDTLKWAKNVVVKITHTPFGIGLPDTEAGISQPDTFCIQPRTPNGDGRAIISFLYDAPPAGHCCLYARIVSIDGVPVPVSQKTAISQNTTVYTFVVNQLAKPMFLVFGHKTQQKTMTLEVSEKPVPGSQPWGFSLDLTQAGGLDSQPSGSAVNLKPDEYRCIFINTTPKGTVSHVFHVRGMENGQNVGEVDIEVKPLAEGSGGQCNPYVTGGIHSPDIILYDPDTNQPIPLPGTLNTNDIVKPNRKYRFAARVHNFSDVPATNTVVRFWQTGFGANGAFLDIVTAPIGANSSAIVESGVPFTSGAVNSMRCAIVTVYNSNAVACHHDAPAFGQLPGMTEGQPSCKAMRNTWSQYQLIKKPVELDFEVIWPGLQEIDPAGPVEVSVITQHIPAGWDQSETVMAIRKDLRRTGALSEAPLCFNPQIRSTFRKLDLGFTVVPGEKKSFSTFEKLAARSIKLEGARTLKAANSFRVTPTGSRERGGATLFRLKGNLPRDVKVGDMVIVHVITRTGKKELANAYDTDNIRVLKIVEKSEDE